MAVMAVQSKERARQRADDRESDGLAGAAAEERVDSGAPEPAAGRWPARGTVRERWTVADRNALPDDGLRYEVVDGLLVVSPSPVPQHQWVSVQLELLLSSACPEGFVMLHAPLDWQVDEHTVFEPDVLVMRRQDVTPERLVGTPVLIVEIASPSTARFDRTLKFERYAQAGVRQYWIVDPGSAENSPTVAVFDLDEATGEYVLQVEASGSDRVDVDGPVPVSMTPADLVA